MQLAQTLEKHIRQYLPKCSLGLSYGVSYPLTLVVLDFWLKDAGVANVAIGVFSLAHLPFTFKFLWGVLVENYDVPGLPKKIGRTRGWIFASNAMLLTGVVGMANADPTSGELGRIAAFASLAAVGDGCKNVVLYTYQINGNNPTSYVASAVGLGHKLGMILTKVATLHLAALYGWKIAYLSAAGAILALMCVQLSMPLPEKNRREQSRETALKNPVERSWLQPLRLLTPKERCSILLVLTLYKSADFFLQKISGLFLAEAGFTKVDIANIVQFWGSACVIIGGLLGGYLIKRLGLPRAMVIFGVLHALSFFLYSLFLKIGAETRLLWLTISYEALTGGCVTTAFITFFYETCRTGAMYALLWAVHDVSGTFFRGISGILVDAMGWKMFFTVIPAAYCAVLAIVAVYSNQITAKN
ncbi:MAG: MFS transporter [Holosporaceae bacterium]|nr:MFS transporter [Holosporaceae bacterium]